LYEKYNSKAIYAGSRPALLPALKLHNRVLRLPLLSDFFVSNRAWPVETDTAKIIIDPLS
jgi:hypothetical protein